LNNIKTEFTIKDLENFSGIKAHTIRIWEKRYNLFQPNRTDSNIRFYDVDNMLKLLNVSLLYEEGMKISKIAKLTSDEIALKVRQLVFTNGFESQAANSFKIAMLNFDEGLFNKTYSSLLNELTFRDIFLNVFIPFLNQIGLLWQVKSITPAHEHFITNLIKQKIQINIEKLQMTKPGNQNIAYVLYLPDAEIHDLGLLYLHFELCLHGKHSIYLGQSVPVENLIDVQKVYNNLCFVTYLTVEPSTEDVESYLNEVVEKVLKNTSNTLWVLGPKLRDIDVATLNFNQVKTFISLKEVLKLL
jgi:DNA-binding transcriptional MerR regulator